jgi:GNAT superfamily N-acetyltransferase
MALSVERLTGSAIASALDDVARLRIAVFADFPYLYDGSLDYERRYLAAFAQAARAVLVVARDGEGRVVGASTGLPLALEHDAFQAPWRARGADVGRMFYFAESVLDPAFRGQGAGHRFFDEREAHARGFGGYTHACFCAVARPDDHPARPKNYRPLNDFWRGRGYEPVEGVVARFGWRDRGETAETDKPLQFWMKAL